MSPEVKRMRPAWWWAGLAAWVALFLVQGERFVRANGPMFDEALHLAAGRSYWAAGRFDLNVEDPPLAKLVWAVPSLLTDDYAFPPEWANGNQWEVGNAFVFAEPGRAEQLVPPARRVNLLFGAGTVVLCGLWGRRAWGSQLAGQVAAGLAAVDPTLTALAGTLNTDAAVTLFAGLTGFLACGYVAAPTPRRLLGVGLALGLALASKFSATVAAAAVLAGLAGVLLAGGWVGPGDGGSLRVRTWAAAGPIARVAVVAVLVLTPVYFVVHLGDWPRGLFWQLGRDRLTRPFFYLLGEVRRDSSPWYFLVALGVKPPLGTLALLGLAAMPWRGGRPAGGWAMLLLPPAAFLALMTASGVNLGVRVVLPAFPWLAVLAARAAAPGGGRAVRLFGCGAALAAAAVAGVSAAPYQLSFFNTLGGGQAGGWRVLGDSNLDWGQGLPAVKEYMNREELPAVYLSYFGSAPPAYYGIRATHLPGYESVNPPPATPVPPAGRQVLVVSTTCFQGLYLKDPKAFAWLWDRPPDAVLAGGSIRVYDLTDDPDGLARVRRLAAERKP